MFDEVYWRWLCSLYPKKKTTKTDPELKRCSNCGYTFKFSSKDYIKMIKKGKLIYTCPRCLYRQAYRLIYHPVPVDDPAVTENNRRLRER